MRGHLTKPGDAVVFASDVFPAFDVFVEEFDTLYLLDVLAGIESAVLHERLLVTGSDLYSNVLLEGLLSEGVAVPLVMGQALPFSPDDVAAHPVASVFHKAA